MKRAKQRKRQYPYKWAGDWSYLDRDVYRELARPGEALPAREAIRILKGEIGDILFGREEKK